MSDDDIDYSDIPPLNDEFFEKAILRLPATQARNLIQIDPDVIAWFQSQSVEYKTLINSVYPLNKSGQLPVQERVYAI
ncbi:MAG: BrnA antitoxin family protein [Nostoc indistinguendum CM1-VF10]|jgi:uncharacterized protein (DUF4415 family)|nr:BrnA antitoxin family protein [Nostoc indistinguendum CM1-VF10]